MANPWFRMYSEFATDAKVQSMSEAMQRRLMMLFCLRCSNALATLQEDELAFALRLSDEDLAETKTLFVRKGFVDEAWNVRNWDKRQFVSDSSTERSRKHREGKKKQVQQEGNVAATAPDADADSNAEAEASKVHKGRSGSASPPAATGKATRLAKEWVLPKSWGDWALAEQPSWTVEHTRHVAEVFRDHWHAKGGADARKVDWEATWRNWVRREGPMPAGGAANGAKAGAVDWSATKDGIKAKADELGLVYREDQGEIWLWFKVRVFAAAGEGPWRHQLLREHERDEAMHARIMAAFYPPNREAA
jgi:hypothetical protein